MKNLPLDYCRCLGVDCPIRDTCLRYTHTDGPDVVAARASSMHRLLDTKKCDAFIPDEN